MEAFAGANIGQLISIAAKVVANQEEMAKREKEKYLEKKGKDPGYGPQGGKQEDWRPEGRSQQKRMEKPSGDIGRMSALTRKKKKEKERMSVATTKSKEACLLETCLGRQV
jgi:hypothetical protein